MKVLHAISGIDPKGGGPTTAILGLAGAQVRAGLDVTLLATWHESGAQPSPAAFEKAGVNVIQIGPARGPISRHPDIAPTARRLIETTDVVHIHAMWEEIQHATAVEARRARKPYVITPHGMLDRWSLSQARLKKTIYMLWRARKNLQSASALHYTTPTEREQSSPLKLRPPTIVEPLGIEAAAFDLLPPVGFFRAKFRIEAECPVVLFMGRIHEGKGLEHLVPAIQRMKTTSAKLVVAGPDSRGFKAKIERLIAQANLEDRVIFCGMVTGDDRLAALHEADVLALPSDHENFGLVVIEALAVGTPVVISDHVYICDDIAAAGAGLVVPIDPERLAAALDRILGDLAFREEMGRQGKRCVRERFDWDVIGRKWAGHYRKVLAGGLT